MDTVTRREVRRATRNEAPDVLATITLAFMADPPCRFVYQHPNNYLRHFPQFVEGFGGRAFEHGGAYYIHGNIGAALWLPPGIHPDDEGLDKLFAQSLPSSHREAVLEVLDQMAGYHPSEPHWHLTMIGVDPLECHKGYGSALLEAGLLPCDQAQETAYLESTNPRNIPLYERFGFEVLGTIKAGNCPPIYPMLRKPKK
jgi:ribosomal protein S18 acetylase RimI-like enzyme